MSYRLGLFDSGIGGTTVLKSIEERHSEFNAVYLADTARLPYGVKSSKAVSYTHLRAHET